MSLRYQTWKGEFGVLIRKSLSHRTRRTRTGQGEYSLQQGESKVAVEARPRPESRTNLSVLLQEDNRPTVTLAFLRELRCWHPRRKSILTFRPSKEKGLIYLVGTLSIRKSLWWLSQSVPGYYKNYHQHLFFGTQEVQSSRSGVSMVRFPVSHLPGYVFIWPFVGACIQRLRSHVFYKAN